MRKLLLTVLLLTALGLAGSTGAVAGNGTAGSNNSSNDPPLSPFKAITLPGAFGDVQAVVYDGNELLIGSSVTTTMTGFGTVPAPPFMAKTTYTVVDGQCSPFVPTVPEPCGLDAGSGPANGDTLAFTGGAGTLTKGPDAWRGHDHCSYSAADSCLWDTRTEDVSAQVAPGDTSVAATVTAGTVGGSDCINHEAQTFAVGPDLAWLTSGYTAAGAGLRNQASNTIAITGIPPGSQVLEADLYWNILSGPTSPGAGMSINGNLLTGTLVKKGGDPCWGNNSSYAFRADVTPYVTGNGAYALSGYPTGTISGLSPFLFGSMAPMAEGASLIVFYGIKPTPGKVTLGGWIDPVTGDLVDPSEISIQNGPPVSVGDKATFGGNVKCCPTIGQFRYIDHAAAEDIKATNMTLLNISDGPCGADTHATFFFEANENGVPGQHFRVDVDDCGEPGSQNPPSNAGPDMLTIQKLPVGYTAGGPLVGGNVQIHKS